jgi:hypothetical protein
MLPAIVKAKDLEILDGNLREAKPFGIERLYTQLGSCHGPAGGAPAAGGGVGGGVSTERTLARGKPPNLARRGEIATKTQELRPALSCEPLPNHVLPLAHFGAISDVHDGGVVRTDHHNAGEGSGSTQHYDLKIHHASVGGW